MEKIKGTRTNSVTGVGREVELEFEIKPGFGESGSKYLWLFLKGGPTGYEGCVVTKESVDRLSKEGWWACAGTRGRWDSLFIPAEEMKKAFASINYDSLPKNDYE